MRRSLALALLALSLSGCKGLRRIIGQGEDPAPVQAVKVITSVPDLAPAPNFAVPTPAGMVRLVYHDYVPASGRVAVRADAPSSVAVFVKDFSGFWFRLGNHEIAGYWYAFDASAGVVQLNAKDMGWLKEFCVYQYVESEI